MPMMVFHIAPWTGAYYCYGTKHKAISAQPPEGNEGRVGVRGVSEPRARHLPDRCVEAYLQFEKRRLRHRLGSAKGLPAQRDSRPPAPRRDRGGPPVEAAWDAGLFSKAKWIRQTAWPETWPSRGPSRARLSLPSPRREEEGRKGRNWFSPPGEGIYVSLVLRPPFQPAEAPKMTLLAGVALAETLIQVVPSRVTIKWPNDVLLGGKKIAGILIEISTDIDAIDYMVVGVGINVNTPSGRFPAELRGRATSLAAQIGHTVASCGDPRRLSRSLRALLRPHWQRGIRARDPALARAFRHGGQAGARARLRPIAGGHHRRDRR